MTFSPAVWLLLMSALVGGCTSQVDAAPRQTGPTILTVNDVMKALKAADVPCSTPQTYKPKPISQEVKELTPAGGYTGAVAAAWEQVGQVEGSVAEVLCGVDGAWGYAVRIAPSEYLERYCSFVRAVAADDPGSVDVARIVESETVVGSNWEAGPADDIAWRARVQPPDVARALGGEVKANECDVPLPSASSS